MRPNRAKWAGILALVGAGLGLVFAAYSTSDYAAHLDRQIHAIHCSFIPGAPVDSADANPCKTALFSAYSALFREKYWGGVPISLFALGAFGFFVGFALFVLLAGTRASRRVLQVLGVVGLTPLAASAVMFTISATQLHTFCKVCVGIYVSSAILASGAVMAWLALRDDATAPAEDKRAEGSLLQAGGWLAGLGVASILPALVYVSTLPDYKDKLTSCGKLAVATEAHGALIKLPTTSPVKAVTLFEDPLCPTCKAFHERMVTEGVFERLDVTLSMFPLDNECNWMLDRSLHPGACTLSKAVLCGKDKARSVLEWSYGEQESLREAGKSGPKALRDRISARFGADILACIDDKDTTVKLNRQLHFAADNHIPVSTPQMFLGDTRLCDEDTDLGLKYTLAQLAPEVLK